MRQALPSRLGLGLGMIDPVSRAVAAEEPQRWRLLMQRAQAGDGPAYAELLRDALPLIRRLVRQNGIRPDTVDDVVQEVLVTIHRARHTFDPSRPFTPWLRAIVQRRGVDVMRRVGRQASRELHVPVVYDSHPDPASGAEQHVVDRGRAEQLAAAVALLPPGQRQALEQLGMQERTLAEAAIATGRSTGALKVNLHRALKSLRAIMGPKEP